MPFRSGYLSLLRHLIAVRVVGCYEWKSNVIEVRGNSLYDSVTNRSFSGKGIAFPNVGENVSDWINVLHRINNLSSEINLVRIYSPPTCALNSDCFVPFIQEADALGVYLLVPGSGVQWGWLPINPDGCGTGNVTGAMCYRAGGVLGWGQTIVQRFNYPNTLAIVVANEFDQRSSMWQFQGVIKAYSRDLKSYMNMCNTNSESPTFGKMRQIPLAFASSDDGGNSRVFPKADYYFCGSSDISIDIFGLNVERWCSPTPGRIEYQNIDAIVSERKYPGAFSFTEMGCPDSIFPGGIRGWEQVPGFFGNFTSVDSFIAYTYYGNPNFDMFDGPGADATINQDGINFFNQTSHAGVDIERAPVDTVVPVCPSTLLGATLDPVDNIPWYDTGSTGWAPQCPKPYDSPIDILV